MGGYAALLICIVAGIFTVNNVVTQSQHKVDIPKLVVPSLAPVCYQLKCPKEK